MPQWNKGQRAQFVTQHYQHGSRKAAAVFQVLNQGLQSPNNKTILKAVKRHETKEGNQENIRRLENRPATNPFNSAAVLACIQNNPITSLREVSNQAGISKASVLRILQREKFHPYKLRFLQLLQQDDYFKRMDFCQTMINRCNLDPDYLKRICFVDEATFFLDGKFNHQNIRYWARVNPHWMRANQTQNAPKVTVLIGIFNNSIVGPFFFDGNVKGQSYLEMLENEIGPTLDQLANNTEVIYLQDGAPAHWSLEVREFLNESFPNSWIGRNGPTPWPARSPDLNPCDFFLWGYVKHQVFSTQPLNIQMLRTRITEVCHGIPNVSNGIPVRMFKNSRKAFYNRLGYCSAAAGHHFEHLL